MKNFSRIVTAILFMTSHASSSELIPEPAIWSFPDVVESALEISPTNIEGRAFNQLGIAYPLETFNNIDLATINIEDLQKYADVVTHAYPDAVIVKSQIPSNCENMPADQFNETSLAGLAFISINAIVESNRNTAQSCLQGILRNLRKK